MDKVASRKVTSGDLDRRQRITVFLMADGRTKYFNFYCVYCGTKVCELSGGQVYQLRDVDDIKSRVTPQLNARCYGRYCHAWYEFVLKD